MRRHVLAGVTLFKSSRHFQQSVLCNVPTGTGQWPELTIGAKCWAVWAVRRCNIGFNPMHEVHAIVLHT